MGTLIKYDLLKAHLNYKFLTSVPQKSRHSRVGHFTAILLAFDLGV